MILAGDVGGTKVRLALFEEKGGVKCIDEEKFASREFANLSDLLKKFLAKEQGRKISAACFGVAGPVKERKCKATNLPWEISADELQKDLCIPRVDLINDLEANAWGLRCLAPDEFCTINEGRGVRGNQALISAGTGLGEAGLYWDGKSHRPFACEGGHCDFSPKNEEEIDLLRYSLKVYTHVSFDRILSGPGLYLIYRFLVDTGREKENVEIAALANKADAPRLITEKGSSNSCPTCLRACLLFVEIYGGEAGNAALKFFAVGGVFIGGGIAPHLIPLLKQGNFLKAFAEKGRLSTVLAQIPVKVVLNEKTALLRAARYAQENR